MRNRSILLVFVFFGLMAVSSPLFPEDEDEVDEESLEPIDCEMRFNFQAWSFFYHYGRGEGTVCCSNDQKVDVNLRTEGGGIINIGAYNIVDGYGEFSPVQTIGQIFGTYAATGGDIGLGDSMSGINMDKTKGGRVKLNLSGSGEGISAGFHYSNFTITPKEASQ